MKPQPPEQDAPCTLPLDGFLPYRLVTAAHAVSRLIARAYDDRFGLTVPEWRLMCVLAESGAQPVAAAAARLVMERSSVGRAARGLAKRRLARVQDGSTGAARPYELTPEGARLHREIAPLALAYEAALTAGLAPAEVAQLKRLLSRLQAAAVTLAGEAPPTP